MEVLRHLWVKKNPALYIVDIGLILAIFRHLSNENFFTADIPQNSVHHEGNVMLMGLAHLPYSHGRMYSTKMAALHYDDILGDYNTIMRDAHHRLPTNLLNSESVRNEVARNVTTMMLTRDSQAQGNVSVMQHPTTSHTEPAAGHSWWNAWDSIGLDVFNETISIAHDHINDLVNNTQTDISTGTDVTQEIDNADEVRWWDYLNQNNDKEKLCDESNMDINCVDPGISVDIETIESSHNDTRTRTTSELSDESGIEIAGETEQTSTNTEFTSQDIQTSPNIRVDACLLRTPEVSIVSEDDSRDLDLMQMMYNQDCDLGFNWNHLNEPVKQINDVDEIQTVKNNNTDLGNFIVDGETGEQIPVFQNQTAAPQANSPAHNHFPLMSNNHSFNHVNVDDYLDDIFTNTGNDNTPIQSHQNEDIWDQFADLSEISEMNLQTTLNSSHIAASNQNIINANMNILNTSIPHPTAMHQMIEEPSNTFNHQSHDSQYEHCYAPVSSLQSQLPVHAMVNYSNPTYNSMQTSPENYMSSSLSSDDGIPMDGISFSPVVNNSDLQEQDLLLSQLNEYDFTVESGKNRSFGSKTPILSTEPGQIFFDQSTTQEFTGALSDLIAMNSPVQSFSTDTPNAYQNPRSSPYHPPPLAAVPSPVDTIPRDQETLGTSTIDRNAISEYSESDSGISLDQSPQGFSYKSRTVSQEQAFQLNDLKSELTHDSDLTFQLGELKAIEHNHTYNGTGGIKMIKKKLEKSHPRESRDERKARELNLPFTLDEIIMSPVEDYNEMLARTPLTPEQQALVKDIRRRGKNKVAAQNCRKRKIDTISNMEDDVDSLREKKQQLEDEKNKLEGAMESMKMRYNSLYQQICASLRDNSGQPYDPSRFRLEQVEGAVVLVPFREERWASNHSIEQDECGELDFSKVKIEKAE